MGLFWLVFFYMEAIGTQEHLPMDWAYLRTDRLDPLAYVARVTAWLLVLGPPLAAIELRARAPTLEPLRWAPASLSSAVLRAAGVAAIAFLAAATADPADHHRRVEDGWALLREPPLPREIRCADPSPLAVDAELFAAATRACAEIRWGWWALGLGLPVAAVAWAAGASRRVWVSALSADADGVRLRGVFRTTTVPWSAVRDVTVREGWLRLDLVLHTEEGPIHVRCDGERPEDAAAVRDRLLALSAGRARP